MKLLATLSAFLFSGIVAASPLHNIVVFGDSLSDNGNLYEFMKHQLPQSPPYFEGRFSNGPVWVEHLAETYFPTSSSIHLLNYAFGGAGVSEEGEVDDVLFTLRREVESYLVSHQNQASDDTLYIVWIGANNYLAMPEEVEQTLTDVNLGITHSLQRLVDHGAKHFLILNLPDLGRTPAAIEFGSTQAMSYFANQHNDSLKKTIANFQMANPQVEWIYFDLNKMFGHVLENPKEYGFSNISGTCSNAEINELTKKSVLQMVASVTPIKTKDACDGFIFFDLVHPTALAHRIIADKVRIMLDETGVEFSE
ncbi:MAG TPA: SGNH/GDSL hydrolase family protein [Legionella sp.]|nr:SGNH/GDSL hydrolase family protein [Legionella sp.]